MKSPLVKLVIMVMGIFYLSAYFELQPQQTGKNIESECHLYSTFEAKLVKPATTLPDLSDPVVFAYYTLTCITVASLAGLLLYQQKLPDKPPPLLPHYKRLYLFHSVFLI